MEILKEIKECNVYKVSSSGRVYSYTVKSNGRELKQSTHRDGYKVVWIYINGKRHTRYVHRLVAIEFVDGFEDGKEVNHKDLDKSNNDCSNLEWVTKSENNLHRDFHVPKSDTQKQVAKSMGSKWGSINGSIRTYDDEFMLKVIELRNQNISFTKIAKHLGCSMSTAYRLYGENKCQYNQNC
jgi:hypothetical protein